MPLLQRLPGSDPFTKHDDVIDRKHTIGTADAGHDYLCPLLSAGLSDALVVCGHDDLAQRLAQAGLLPGAHHHGHAQDLDQRLSREAHRLVARWYDTNLWSSAGHVMQSTIHQCKPYIESSKVQQPAKGVRSTGYMQCRMRLSIIGRFTTRSLLCFLLVVFILQPHTAAAAAAAAARRAVHCSFLIGGLVINTSGAIHLQTL